MADEITSQQPVSIPMQAIPLAATPQKNILEQTLGDILQNNPQAQQMIIQSMGISQENFAQMLSSAQQNNMMQMKIGDLFKNGVVQQAVMQQNGQPLPQKTSFLDKVKSWFR